MAQTTTARAGRRAWLPLTRNLTAAVALALVAAAPAVAHEPVLQAKAAQTHYHAKAQLNLLGQPKPDSRRTTRRTSSVGRGSYICSPAGFGQRSRCYAN